MNVICKLYFIVVISTLCAGCTIGAKNYYTIEKSWADQQSLYVLYESHYSLGGGTLFSIHGGYTLYDKRNLFLKKYNKIKVVGSLLNLLADGELIAPIESKLDLNYFLDQELFVQERAGITSISSGINSAKFKCDHNTWGNQLPIKFGEEVFYCGYLFSTTTGKVTQFPLELISKIQEKFLTHDKLSVESKLMYVSENNYLLIKSERDISPYLVKIQIDNFNNIEFTNPFYLDAKKFRSINNYVSYSTAKNKFLYQLKLNYNQRSDPISDEIYICGSTKCEVLSHRSYSYLVLDETSDDVLFLHAKDLVTPEISVEVVHNKGLRSIE